MCEPNGDTLSTVGLRDDVCVPTDTMPTVTMLEGNTVDENEEAEEKQAEEKEEEEEFEFLGGTDEKLRL